MKKPQIDLRPYQQDAAQTVVTAHESGIKKQLIVLPCGTGKTIIMAALAKHYNKRTLIIAHRDELIEQTKKKFKLFWPSVSLGICKADENDINKSIVIGSIQTCSRNNRLAQLKNEGFEILLIDEAHHACAATYKKLIRELGFDDGKLLIGFTATPDRPGKEQLGDIFQEIVFSRSISTMIDAGYLCHVIGRRILTTTSLAGIKSVMGDFEQHALADRVDNDERNDLVVQKYLQYAAGKKGVAFCVDVKHARDLAGNFNKNGIPAAAIWGDMPVKDRRKVLRSLARGKIKIATSVGVLTEGFDETSLQVALMCTPTKSAIKYTQCVGRVLRLHPGKNNALVLDFADSGHSLDKVMSLQKSIPTAPYQIDASGIEKERQPKMLEQPSPINEVIDTEFDILGKQQFIWIDIGDGEFSLLDDAYREIVLFPVEDGYLAKLFDKKMITFVIDHPLPLDYARGVCEDFARQYLETTFCEPRDWMHDALKKAPTPNQVAMLEELGIDAMHMSKMEAFIAIRTQTALNRKAQRNNEQEPITEKQLFFLKKCGLEESALTSLSKRDAMGMISSIKNGSVSHVNNCF